MQLLRFLQATAKKGWQIKVAAYHKSNPGISVDWNLEALKDIWEPDKLVFDSPEIETYFDQVQYFDPDLIISDLELFTSHVAGVLAKPLWQVSPLLLHSATPHREKSAIGLFKYYPQFFANDFKTQLIKNVVFNSDKRLVYHHLGDTNQLQLVDSFEWVRPYHVIGKESKPCEHHVVACAFRNDKKFLDYLKRYRDVVFFSNFIDESYAEVILKSVYDWPEYQCNLKNCDVFVGQGHTDFLADAYYNGKQSAIVTDYREQECVINSLYAAQFDFSKANYDSNIKFLHEHIENL